MLKIRLQRVGRKHDPSYRVVVTESQRGPKSGDYIEILGHYNPKFNKVEIKGDRVKHWISNGAQASDTVHNLLVSQKIIEGKKVNVLPKKKPIVKEVKKEDKKETPAENVEKAPEEKTEEKTEKTEEIVETPKEKAEEEKKEESVPAEESPKTDTSATK